MFEPPRGGVPSAIEEDRMTQLVDHVEPGNHLVQFYDAEPAALVANLASFIGEGLERGDSVVVIATPEHTEAFMEALGARRDAPEVRTRLVMLDAAATLALFMVNGQPDRQRFEHVVGGTIRGLRRANPGGAVRAYGEMVGVLWAAGCVEAAIQLEKFWNVLLRGNDFTLFCGYPIDVFAADFDTERMDGVLRTHTHVVPAGAGSAMRVALDRALRDVLGREADVVHHGADATANPACALLPSVEATILWLRDHQPAYAGDVLARTRSYYTARV
jgi:hypothetical protein